MTPALSEALSQLDQYCTRSLQQLWPTLLQPQDLETPYSRYSTESFIVPADHAPIDAIVAERQSQMTDLTQGIKRMQKLYQRLNAVQTKLKERRSHVEESLRLHRALTSPIRQLSPEILGEIFCSCLPDHAFVFPSAKKGPLVLTRVCRRWRSVALSTPQLWSSLLIHLKKVAAMDEYRLECETWLARARGIPLALEIFNDISKYDVDRIRHLADAADWLQPLVSRCRNLRFHGKPLQGLLTRSGTVELLERLYLDVDSIDGTPSVQVSTSANKLRSLHLYTSEIHSLRGIMLPWEQLTEMDVSTSSLSLASALQLLKLCTSLQKATLSFMTESDLPEGAQAVVTSYSLRVLTMQMFTSAPEELLLDRLVLPSLEELEIRSLWVAEKWLHTQFISFLTRSGCPLKKLRILNNKSASSYLSEYQALLPSSCSILIKV